MEDYPTKWCYIATGGLFAAAAGLHFIFGIDIVNIIKYFCIIGVLGLLALIVVSFTLLEYLERKKDNGSLCDDPSKTLNFPPPGEYRSTNLPLERLGMDKNPDVTLVDGEGSQEHNERCGGKYPDTNERLESTFE